MHEGPISTDYVDPYDREAYEQAQDDARAERAIQAREAEQDAAQDQEDREPWRKR